MTVNTKPDWLEQLTDLLEDQLGIYQQLEQMADQQSQLVSGPHAEELLSLLSSRQALIDRLSAINGRLEPFKEDWPTRWARLDPASQGQVQGLMQQVEGLLAQILARDEQDRARLLSQRQEILQDMSQVDVGSAVNRAYGRSAPPAQANRYTDAEG